MRMAPAAIAAPFLLSLLTWLLVNGLDLDSARFDRELRALDDFSRFERGFNREILSARVGVSRSYDALVRMTEAYDDALDRLRVAAGPNSEESAAIEVLAATAERQEILIEQFKSRNALLRNSFAYFGILSARLASSDYEPLIAVAGALATAMLHLALDTSPVAVREVQNRLNELASLQRPPSDADTIQALIAHGGILHDLLPATDAVLKGLVAAASNREQEAVRSSLLKRQLASQASAGRYRVFLYATSLFLLGSLVYFGLKLRARAIALRRRSAFEHVIAGISTRFINSQHHDIAEHVESALEKLAECIGADRAYFVVAVESRQVYRWSREGVELPKAWPVRALQLASRFDRGEDGIIHIPKVRASGLCDATELLADAGLHGWLCIQNASEKRAASILGFDSMRVGGLTKWTEFALFLTAFDAIANAVGRVVLEREKERLEASLQQARRMETIGTFASGIAHNFNNIVGAILGYTEMANTDVGSGGGPSANLVEIRRAGERARELVDQILTFGRRGKGRRERICIKALVAETQTLLAASLPSHVGITINKVSEMTIVWAEPAQLQQVILNVCYNAAQAMDEPGIIAVQVEVQEATDTLRVGPMGIGPGRFVTISISDPGRGMDEETLERIFDPFFTTRPDGNGLGLATVRDIVQDLDGAIEVQSTLGAGTRFVIWLPSVTSNETIAVQHAPGTIGRGDGETVLVLEKDRERLLRYEEILAALGYEPVGFTRLREVALADAARARFDAALVCHQAGANSPLDLAAALHDIAPTLPIILVTPSARDLDAPILVTSGISEVVHGPVTFAELGRVLSRCLRSTPAVAIAEQVVDHDL
jgi:signal transduction histidine kinase/CheY-like chemotaxis protein